MRLRIWWHLGIALAVSLSALAQSTLIGPVEGFVFDAPSRSVRAVVGLVGASSFGPILVRGVDYASVAPRKDYGIAIKGGYQMFVSGLGSGMVSTSTLMSTAGTPEGAVWSGDGSMVVLYSRSGNWIQPLAGFPGHGAAAAGIDLTPLGGSLLAVAADQSGQRIAIGLSGDSGGVFVMDATHGFARVFQATRPVGLAFSADGETLYALDAATAQITQFNLVGFVAQSLPLNGLTDAVALAVARDASGRQTIYVAGGQDRTIQAYDASSHTLLANVPLGFTPSSLAAFGIDSYILGPRTGASEPLWSFRAAPVPAVYFVPATPLTLPEGRRK